MSDQHEPEYPCDCHCPVCHGPLVKVTSLLYASCGDCYGGSAADGEAFRGGEAAACEAEQMAHIQRTLK